MEEKYSSLPVTRETCQWLRAGSQRNLKDTSENHRQSWPLRELRFAPTQVMAQTSVTGNQSGELGRAARTLQVNTVFVC